jgi:hypothetical protein
MSVRVRRCRHCGVERRSVVAIYGAGLGYCSVGCFLEAKKARYRSVAAVCNCAWCGSGFVPRTHGKYCSGPCRKNGKRRYGIEYRARPEAVQRRAVTAARWNAENLDKRKAIANKHSRRMRASADYRERQFELRVRRILAACEEGVRPFREAQIRLRRELRAPYRSVKQ